MGVTPAGKMGSWSCAMVLPASLAPAFPPRNCPFLVQSIFLASHKLPPHFRMSDVHLGTQAAKSDNKNFTNILWTQHYRIVEHYAKMSSKLARKAAHHFGCQLS